MFTEVECNKLMSGGEKRNRSEVRIAETFMQKGKLTSSFNSYPQLGLCLFFKKKLLDDFGQFWGAYYILHAKMCWDLYCFVCILYMYGLGDFNLFYLCPIMYMYFIKI